MSTTYSSRPVFSWPIDWATLPQSRLEVDLDELVAGFGEAALYTDQAATIRGWQFTCWADSEAEIQALEDWFDALAGRLVGFWLPTPEAPFRITANVSTTQFKIADAGLADTWQDHPDPYLWLTKDGETPQGAQITGVTDNGDGTETVTTAEAVDVDATWAAQWLAYVRLADDVESAEALAEGTQRRTVKVLELPGEYTALETGAQPVWLYHFFTTEGTQTDWYLTSHAWDLDAILSIDWVASRLTHGALTFNTRGRAGVTIEADRIDPLARLLPMTLGQPLYLEIKRAEWATMATQSTVFTGKATSARAVGRRLSVQFEALEDPRSKVPGFLFSARCPHRVYAPNTCRATQASFEKACVLDSFDDELQRVVISGAAIAGLAEDWFAGGWIETGSNEDTERRTILHSTSEGGSGTITLTLNHPLANASATDAATVVPGCNGTETDCTTKFSNFVNFGGCRFALRNLALQAIEVEAISGGKK